MLFSRALAVFLIINFTIPLSLIAQEASKTRSKGANVVEYWYSREDGEVLIPVNLWGIGRVGRYNVPKNLTLTVTSTFHALANFIMKRLPAVAFFTK